MTDDLSTRLLAEIEKRAEVASGACWEGASQWSIDEPCAHIQDDRGEVVVYDEGSPSEGQREHIVLNDPAAVLRLCQAHREIVEMHRADPEQPYSWGGQTCSECSSEECGHYVRYPCPTLRTLATAYGIQEET